MKNLISVIIPVYNVELYIEECLDSILNQTYNNLEIICVDDCGTDDSIKIVEEYAKKDQRIKIIYHKENQGLGEARNTGLKNATGEYIYFIDSDDFIDLDYIEKLYKAIEEKQVDFICNYKILNYYNKNAKQNNFIIKENKIKQGLIYNKIDNNFPISAWCKLYRLGFLIKNELYFVTDNLKFEDFYLVYILKTKKFKMSYIYDSTYYYRQRQKSIMYNIQYKNNDCQDQLEIIKKIFIFYKQNNFLEYYFIPFNWLNKYFKKQNNKQEFFIKIKDFFIKIKDDVLSKKNLYSKKDFIFFNCVLNSKNYYLFKLKYIFSKILNK